MDTESVLYFDGSGAPPSLVRVLAFQEHLHLYKGDDRAFYESFPLSGISKSHTGNHYYFYLDNTASKYLQCNKDQPCVTVIASELEKNSENPFQKLVKQNTLVLLAVLAGLAIGLYFLLVNVITLLGIWVISVEQEIKIGDKLQEVMINEAQVNHKVDVTGTRLLQQFVDKLELSDKYPIRATVLNGDIVNAYALPGGHVVVYKGLLEQIENFEELTALIAHESAHINERHTLRSMLRSTSVALIISIVFGDASTISGAIISNAETLNRLRFSRSLETEADLKGMKLMQANKVDVTGMKELMMILQKEEKMPGSLSFFSTHPLTEERILAAERFVAKNQGLNNRRNDLKIAFRRLKDKMSKQVSR